MQALAALGLQRRPAARRTPLALRLLRREKEPSSQVPSAGGRTPWQVSCQVDDFQHHSSENCLLPGFHHERGRVVHRDLIQPQQSLHSVYVRVCKCLLSVLSTPLHAQPLRITGWILRTFLCGCRRAGRSQERSARRIGQRAAAERKAPEAFSRPGPASCAGAGQAQIGRRVRGRACAQP